MSLLGEIRVGRMIVSIAKGDRLRSGSAFVVGALKIFKKFYKVQNVITVESA